MVEHRAQCVRRLAASLDMSAARREMLNSSSLKWTFKTFSRDYQLYKE